MNAARTLSRRSLMAGMGLLTVASVGLFLLHSAQAQTKPQPTASPSAGQEVSLTKRVIAARREYQASLEQIRNHYMALSDSEKLRWAEDELKSFHRVPKHPYVLDLDVPGPGLKAEQNVPAANDLYKRAMSYKDQGSGNEYQDNQIRAELLFQQLVNQYPSSNKISDAAFQLGEIYEGRIYKMYRRAAAYYERCFQWNPNTQLDARLRAARIYDKNLSERSKALELYKAVMAHETDQKRLQEAQRRLNELSSTGP